VVPVLVYENVGPIEALKRSALLVKEKWGESIGANFSFGIFYFLGVFLIALPIGYVSYSINPIFGISFGLFIVFLISIVISAAQTVFIAGVYQHARDRPIEYFGSDHLENVFTQK